MLKFYVARISECGVRQNVQNYAKLSKKILIIQNIQKYAKFTTVCKSMQKCTTLCKTIQTMQNCEILCKTKGGNMKRFEKGPQNMNYFASHGADD